MHIIYVSEMVTQKILQITKIKCTDCIIVMINTKVSVLAKQYTTLNVRVQLNSSTFKDEWQPTQDARTNHMDSVDDIHNLLAVHGSNVPNSSNQAPSDVTRD